MSKSQRVKGATGERDWCEFLKSQGIDAKRLLGQARDGGGDVPAPPFLWEVKRRRGMAFYKWLEQCEVALAADHRVHPESPARRYPGCKVPAVAARADGKEWVVVLSARDFFTLLKRETA